MHLGRPRFGRIGSCGYRKSYPGWRRCRDGLSSPWDASARGQAENHIKAWKNHLAADRTSCHAAEANQFVCSCTPRLTGCYGQCAASCPNTRHGGSRNCTLRLRLIKLTARVIELKTQVKIHLPSSAPDQAIFAVLLDRLPRLVT